MAEDSQKSILTLVTVTCVRYIKLLVGYALEWIHCLGDRSPSTPGLKIITGLTRFMPLMEKKVSDKHWDSKIARKPFRTPNDVLAHLKQCEYRVGHLLHRPTSVLLDAHAGSTIHMSSHRASTHSLVESKAPKGRQPQEYCCCLQRLDRLLNIHGRSYLADSLRGDESGWHQHRHRCHAASHQGAEGPEAPHCLLPDQVRPPIPPFCRHTLPLIGPMMLAAVHNSFQSSAALDLALDGPSAAQVYEGYAAKVAPQEIHQWAPCGPHQFRAEGCAVGCWLRCGHHRRARHRCSFQRRFTPGMPITLCC